LIPPDRKPSPKSKDAARPSWRRLKTSSRVSLPENPKAATMPQAVAPPDDIANAVVYLSSDTLARHVTGQTVVVAGGMEGRLLWQPEEIDPSAV